MDAFYIYSKLLINNEVPIYESKLIDIKADNLYKHNIILKSSKPNVKPLNIKIGNSLFSDIINCFDQLNESSKIRLKKSFLINKVPKKATFGLKSKIRLLNIFLPPLFSICSLILFSSILIHFYNPIEDNERNELINQK